MLRAPLYVLLPAVLFGTVGAQLPCSPFAPAVAHAADDNARAKELYKKATAHYGVGEYEQAAEAYQEAYKLKTDPALLFNAAQSYRLAGKLEKALTLYKNYLRLYPDVSNAEEVRGRVSKLEEQIAAERAAKATPPPVSEPPPPAPTAPPPVQASPVPAADTGVAASAPKEAEDDSITKKPWFWVAVGGAAAAAVVIVILAASGGGSDWANAPEVRQSGLGAGVIRW